MLKHHTPDTVRAPFAQYSHAVEVPPGSRLLICSGQLGIAPDEAVPADAGEQTALCLANIEAVLQSAGMGRADIVRINAFVSAREHLGPYMAARDAFISGIDPPPASTLMIVTGFARDEFKVEVEVIAAQGGEP